MLPISSEQRQTKWLGTENLQLGLISAAAVILFTLNLVHQQSTKDHQPDFDHLPTESSSRRRPCTPPAINNRCSTLTRFLQRGESTIKKKPRIGAQRSLV